MRATTVVLINIGTPESLAKKAVATYLHAFLMDPRIIPLPRVLRWLLVHGIIVPRRAKQSLHAYQQIWQPEGSPLAVYSQNLQDRLEQELSAQGYQVVTAMCYSAPRLEDVLKNCRSEEIILCPLFPQYAAVTTGGILAAAYTILGQRWDPPQIHTLQPFADNLQFTTLLADKIKSYGQAYDHLLFSFHGLPVDHLHQSQCQGLAKGACILPQPCPSDKTHQAWCYRAQCYATARQVVKHLQISPAQWSVSFQSRFGRKEWIKPYTEEQLKVLYEQGVRKLAVSCPAFVTDCLETLEEIGLRLRDEWLAFPGTSFHLIPCLNADEAWVKLLASWIQKRGQVGES